MLESIESKSLVKIIVFMLLQMMYLFVSLLMSSAKGTIAFFVLLWVFPSVILITGYLLSIRYENVSVLKILSFICSIYILLLSIYAIFLFLYDISRYCNYCDFVDYFNYLADRDGFYVLLVFVFWCVFFVFTKSKLLIKPIENNFEKIITNGLFFHKKTGKGILNQDGNNHYSASEELLKWSELKDKGIISDSEFMDMKDKILSKK